MMWVWPIDGDIIFVASSSSERYLGGSELYVHRSGRTARARREGVSIVLIGPSEMTSYHNICKTLQRGLSLADSLSLSLSLSLSHSLPLSLSLSRSLPPSLSLPPHPSLSHHRWNSFVSYGHNVLASHSQEG